MSTAIVAPSSRQQKAAAIAARGDVFRTGERWQVLSESTGLPYKVDPVARQCECKDYQRGNECKHILSAVVVLKAEEKVRRFAAEGRLEYLDGLAKDKSLTRSQFELDTATIVARAIREYRERQQAERQATSPAPAPMPVPVGVSTREERETARPAPYYRHNPARRWKA